MEATKPSTKDNPPNMEMLFAEMMGLPKLVFWGDELIELDESMFSHGLCEECKALGYCKRNNSLFTETIQS